MHKRKTPITAGPRLSDVTSFPFLYPLLLTQKTHATSSHGHRTASHFGFRLIKPVQYQYRYRRLNVDRLHEISLHDHLTSNLKDEDYAGSKYTKTASDLVSTKTSNTMAKKGTNSAACGKVERRKQVATNRGDTRSPKRSQTTRAHLAWRDLAAANQKVATCNVAPIATEVMRQVSFGSDETSPPPTANHPPRRKSPISSPPTSPAQSPGRAAAWRRFWTRPRRSRATPRSRAAMGHDKRTTMMVSKRKQAKDPSSLTTKLRKTSTLRPKETPAQTPGELVLGAQIERAHQPMTELQLRKIAGPLHRRAIPILWKLHRHIARDNMSRVKHVLVDDVFHYLGESKPATDHQRFIWSIIKTLQFLVTKYPQFRMDRVFSISAIFKLVSCGTGEQNHYFLSLVLPRRRTGAVCSRLLLARRLAEAGLHDHAFDVFKVALMRKHWRKLKVHFEEVAAILVRGFGDGTAGIEKGCRLLDRMYATSCAPSQHILRKLYLKASQGDMKLNDGFLFELRKSKHIPGSVIDRLHFRNQLDHRATHPELSEQFEHGQLSLRGSPDDASFYIDLLRMESASISMQRPGASMKRMINIYVRHWNLSVLQDLGIIDTLSIPSTMHKTSHVPQSVIEIMLKAFVISQRHFGRIYQAYENFLRFISRENTILSSQEHIRLVFESFLRCSGNFEDPRAFVFLLRVPGDMLTISEHGEDQAQLLNVKPTMKTWAIVMDHLLRRKRVQLAIRVRTVLEALGVTLNSIVYRNFFRQLDGLGRYDEAVEAYQKLKRLPEDPENPISRLLAEVKEPEKLRAAFRRNNEAAEQNDEVGDSEPSEDIPWQTSRLLQDGLDDIIRFEERHLPAAQKGGFTHYDPTLTPMRA